MKIINKIDERMFDLQSYGISHVQEMCGDILDGDVGFVTKLVEDILILVRGFYRATCKEDYALAIITFSKLRSTKSFTHILLEQWDKVMGLFLQSEDENVFSKLRGLLDNYARVKTLPLFKKMYKFLLYCIGTSLFEKMGVTFDFSRFIKVEEATLKKNFTMGPDFVHCMLDTLLFFCETGYQCMKTGSMDPIFHSVTAYEKWLEGAELLKIQVRHISNPEPHGFTIFDFLNRLDMAIEKGEAIVKFQKTDDGLSKVPKYILNELRIIRADCLTRQLAQKDRKAPFAILIAGHSSVGKSTFTKMCYYQFGKLMGLPIDPEYRYVRNPFDKHWVNFNSSQWCVQLDDIAFMHPNKSQGPDPSLMEMLQVVNNVPYVPTQAELADKGKTPLRSRFVIATTNTESLNAADYFACPLAVQRRLPYVVSITPREEYLKDGFMLDTAALPPTPPGQYPDFWRITVKKVIPTTKVNTHMGQVGELIDVAIFEHSLDFIKWFNVQAQLAETVQDASMSCDAAMEGAKLCPCGIPFQSCHGVIDAAHTNLIRAAQLQSDELIVYNTPWVQEVQRRLRDQREDREYNYQEHLAENYAQEQDREAALRRARAWDRGLLESVMRMSWFHRLSVWWFSTVLWIFHSGWMGKMFIYFFFGNWYLYYMYTSLLYIPEFRRFAVNVIGARAYVAVGRNKNALIIIAAVSSIVTVYKAFGFVSDIRGYFSGDPPVTSVEDKELAQKLASELTREQKIAEADNDLRLKKFEHETGQKRVKYVKNMKTFWPSSNLSCMFGLGPKTKQQIIDEADSEYGNALADLYVQLDKAKWAHKKALKSLGVTKDEMKSKPWRTDPENFPDDSSTTSQDLVESTQILEAELQGISAERGRSPEPKGDKEEGVWYKDNYECTTFDVTPSTLSKATWSTDEFCNLVRANCVFFSIKYRETEDLIHEKRTMATCIGGHIYMCNNHSVPTDVFQLELICQSGKDGITRNLSFLVTQVQLMRYPERDIVFIKIPNVPPKKNICNLFVKKTFQAQFDGVYFGRNMDGSSYVNAMYAPTLVRNSVYEHEALTIPITCDMWKATTATLTTKGDCGALMISRTAMGPAILGIHVLGSINNVAHALAVDCDFLNDLFPNIIEEGVPTLQVGTYIQTLGDLHFKSAVRFIDQGSAEVYGSFIGHRSRLRSRVTKTFMHDLAIEHGYVCRTAAPDLNSWVPKHKALKEMVKPISGMNSTILEHAKQCYIADVMKGLTPEDLKEVHVYDLDTAVNGKPGLAYVDKMNRNTSAGFPFNKSKKYFMTAREATDEYPNAVDLTPEVAAEVDKVLECYGKKKLYCPIFNGSLKDEARSVKKVLAGELRLFCAANFPWSVAVRMYYMSLIRLVQKHRLLFEAGPGTIAQSEEWHELRIHLTHFGLEQICDGDYKLFDKQVAAMMMLASFDILIYIAVAAGYSQDDENTMQGMAEDIAFAWLNFFGCLIRLFCSNPSGQIITVIINGLLNCLYMRYAYCVLNPAGTCTDFKENVHLMTYGDDMIMGVSPKCPWFNHVAITKVLADIGVGFTMGDKLAKSVPYIHIDKASFLKRTWRFEPELGVYVCPLDHESLDKMMTMHVASKTMSPQKHSVEVMHTALREYFWYGRPVFEEKYALFTMFMEKLQLEAYSTRPFPTWDQLVGEFKANSKLRE